MSEKPKVPSNSRALVKGDTEARFRVLAARGSKRRGIALLDKFDQAFA